MNKTILDIDPSETIRHIFSVVFEDDFTQLDVVTTSGPADAARLYRSGYRRAHVRLHRDF